MIEESIYKILGNEKEQMNYQNNNYNQIKREKKKPVLPTGSTFINHTTFRPGVTNLGGDINLGREAHTHKGTHSTFGKPKNQYKPSTANYLKKNSQKMGNHELPEIKKFNYTKTKENIPKLHEKPILGLNSNKNFIKENICNNVNSIAKKIEKPVNYTQKQTYGKVPNYLKKVKNMINEEINYNRMVQEARINGNNQNELLSEEEVNCLVSSLRNKYEYLNREYQGIVIKTVDTVGIKNKKESLEREMMQIEKDLRLLEKNYIFVRNC